MTGEEGVLTTYDLHETKRRALVVDDDEVIRKLVAEVVKTNGYETETAEDGADALAQYESSLLNNPFQIIISDMIMPNMGGDQLRTSVNKLADSRGLKRPYFIGMSGYDQTVADYGRRVDGYSKNALAFLQKPFGVPALKKILSDAEQYIVS